MMKVPDFIIIGAAKCGTTSVYNRLSMHPNVFMTTPKEPGYFSRDDVFVRGERWYRDLFGPACDGQICGEASTLYSLPSCFPNTVSRMYSFCPNAKLIYILRDPVERAYSYYSQLVKNYQNVTGDFSVNRSFEECLFPEDYPSRASAGSFFSPHDMHLKDSPRFIIEGGMYMANLQDYMKFYRRENILLVRFEDLASNIEHVISRICKFIGVDVALLPDVDAVKVNVASEHYHFAKKEKNRRIMVEYIKSVRLLGYLSKFIPRRFSALFFSLFAIFYRGEVGSVVPMEMTNKTRKYLKDLYLPEIEKLEVFLGEDLDTWK
jgi:hypothetical protein